MLVGALDPARRREVIDGYASAGPRSAGDGMDAAHHPRPVDGHPVIAVEPRRLQGGGRRRRRLWPRLPDDDDRRRARSARPRCSSWASASPGCRRSPPPSASARRSARPTSARRPGSRSSRSAPSRSSSRMSPGSRARARAATRPRCREEYQKAQAELVSGHIAKQDIVITTALIPGRPAPRLISDAQLATMRPGSVIVDLAAEAGGNVEGMRRRRDRREAWRDDHRRVQPGAQPGGGRLGAVRAQPLQFPQPPSGTRSRARRCFPTMTRSSKAIRLTQGGKVVHERLTAAP